MKVAVIGAGKWGQNLVKGFHELGCLSSVADACPETQHQLAKTYARLKIHDSFEQVIESDVTAVAIATPVPTHYKIAEKALLADKDVFIEKPMTLHSEEAQTLTELAKERNKILMVGHMLLYQPAIQWIKAFLKEGNLGMVHSFHQERLKLGRVRKVENVLWSFGVHDLAVLFYLIGRAPKTVTQSGQRILQPNVEDDVYLHMTFEGGEQAHLHTSWLWPEVQRRLTIVGSKGMLVYDEVKQEVVLHKKSIKADLSNQDDGTEVVFDGAGTPLKLELEHFLHCVKERQQPLSDGQSAVDVIRVLEKATRH